MGTDPQLALDLAKRRGAEMRDAAERDRLARRARGDAGRDNPRGAGEEHRVQDVDEQRRGSGWWPRRRLAGERSATR